MVKHFRVPDSLRVRLEEAGVLVPAVLRRAGLPQNFFEQTRILVSTEELFALCRAIGEVSKDTSIGVHLGTGTSIARFHPMGLAALSTESFGAAIEHTARYKRLSAPEEILHDTVEGEWAIRFRWFLAVDVELAVLVEHCFAWVLAIAREGTGTRIKPLRVELVQPRNHTKSLERHFGCPVVCGASRNAIIFRAKDSGLGLIPGSPSEGGLLHLGATDHLVGAGIRWRSAAGTDLIGPSTRDPDAQGSRGLGEDRQR